jgi:hypothetical protein
MRDFFTVSGNLAPLIFLSTSRCDLGRVITIPCPHKNAPAEEHRGVTWWSGEPAGVTGQACPASSVPAKKAGWGPGHRELSCPKTRQYTRALEVTRIFDHQFPFAEQNCRNFQQQWSVDSPNPEQPQRGQEYSMHSVIYLVGLIVVVMLILSALGLR